MNRSFYARYAWPIMIVLALLWPAILWGASKAFHSSNNNVYEWIPQDFPQSRQYEELCRRFGTDDFALVSWNGCTLDDGRLEEFARRCEQSKWFDRVNTGPRLLGTLTDQPFNLSREEALVRLEGTLSAATFGPALEVGQTDIGRTGRAMLATRLGEYFEPSRPPGRNLA